MFGSFHFSFFVLVDEVTKNENKLRDFLYDVFCLQGKTGKMKMKNNRKINKLLRNIFVFRNFVNQNEKWNEPNKWHDISKKYIYFSLDSYIVWVMHNIHKKTLIW